MQGHWRAWGKPENSSGLFPDVTLAMRSTSDILNKHSRWPKRPSFFFYGCPKLPFFSYIFFFPSIFSHPHTHSRSHPAMNLGQQTVKDVKLIPQLHGENVYMWRRERETEVLFEVGLEHQTLHLKQDERLKAWLKFFQQKEMDSVMA